MKVFAVALAVFIGAVLAEDLHSTNLNQTPKPKHKLRPFRTSEKSVAVVEQTHSRNHANLNGLDERPSSPNWNDMTPNDMATHEKWEYPKETFEINHAVLDERPIPPNWNDMTPNDISNANRNHDTWVSPEETFSRYHAIPNVLDERPSSANWYDMTPNDMPNPNGNHVNWVFPQETFSRNYAGFDNRPISPDWKDITPNDISNPNRNQEKWVFPMDTFPRNQAIPNDLYERPISPNWNNMPYNDIPNPKYNQDNWVIPKETEIQVFPNGLDERTPSPKLNVEQPNDFGNPKRNQEASVFPEENTNLRKTQLFKKAQISPQFNKTQTKNGTTEYQILFGRRPWKPFKPHVGNFNMTHNTTENRQHQQKLGTQIIPHGLDKKTPSGKLNTTQAPGRYNYKGNSIRIVFPDEYYRQQTLTKSNLTPNMNRKVMIHPGNFKDGQKNLKGQNKWETPFHPNGNSMGWIFPGEDYRERPLTKKHLIPTMNRNEMAYPGNFKGGQQNFKGQTKWQTPFHPNGVVKTTPSGSFNSKANPIRWVFPDEYYRQRLFTKTHLTPNMNRNEMAYPRNFNGRHQTFGGQTKWETDFLPNGLDKRIPSGNWNGRQPNGMNNLKGKTMGWIFPEDNQFRKDFREQSLRKSVPSIELNGIIPTGNLKGGLKAFEGQTKWSSPTSSVYVDYPGKRKNAWQMKHQQQRLRTTNSIAPLYNHYFALRPSSAWNDGPSGGSEWYPRWLNTKSNFKIKQPQRPAALDDIQTPPGSYMKL